MADQLESLVAEQMFDVAARATEEIINANYISPLAEEAFAKVRARNPDPPVTNIRCLRCIEEPLLVFPLTVGNSNLSVCQTRALCGSRCHRQVL